jgi:hypothetical protein
VVERIISVCGKVIDRGVVVRPEDVEEEAHRSFADVPHRLRDGRQRRIDVAREADVVESHHREVAGHAHAALPRRLSSTPIAISSLKQKTSRRPHRLAEEAIGRFRAGLDREVAADDVELAFQAGEPRAVSRRAAGRAERAHQRAGHDADALMTEGVQVLDAVGGRLRVLSMCTPGTLSRELNLAAVDDGAQRGAMLRMNACAASGRRWPRKIRPTASFRRSISA